MTQSPGLRAATRPGPERSFSSFLPEAYSGTAQSGFAPSPLCLTYPPLPPPSDEPLSLPPSAHTWSRSKKRLTDKSRAFPCRDRLSGHCRHGTPLPRAARSPRKENASVPPALKTATRREQRPPIACGTSGLPGREHPEPHRAGPPVSCTVQLPAAPESREQSSAPGTLLPDAAPSAIRLISSGTSPCYPV